MRKAGSGPIWKSDAYRGNSSRGRITEFSEGSRDRLLQRSFELGEWYSPDQLLTLTYPGKWRAVAPDGPTCRRHLKALRKRLERYFAQVGICDWSALWFREFQRRGAPHFHLLLWGPGLSALDVRQARRWLARAWVEIVGAPDPVERAKHRKAGTGWEVYRADHFGYAAAYAAKPHQKKVPDDFADPGRFWGLWSVTVPAPIVLSVPLSFPRLVELVERLAETVRKHSPRFADALPQRLHDCYVDGWSFSARVMGRDAAELLLRSNLDPPTADGITA